MLRSLGVGPLVVFALVAPAVPATARGLTIGLPSGLLAGLFHCAFGVGPLGTPPSTIRVSVDSAANQGEAPSCSPSLTADGRYVAFYSYATNLVPGDTNDVSDVFVHDRQAGQTTRVSVNSAGHQANDGSCEPAISADRRYVAFYSDATNLVSGDTNETVDIFLHDGQTGQTTRASVDSAGHQGDNSSWAPAISADGRYVAFYSYASNLVPGDTNGKGDVFVRDRQTGQTTRASVDSAGGQGYGQSVDPSLSGDGRYVAFASNAPNLVAGDTNNFADVFVHDRQTGQTTRVSVDSAGNQANMLSQEPSLSADGRYVAFHSLGSNLVPGDTNGSDDVFRHDCQTGQTTRVSVDSAGAQGNEQSVHPSISADGRYVTFSSTASNLVAGDTNGTYDVFLHDCQTGRTTRVSLSSAGRQGNEDSAESPSPISQDGRYVAFDSLATNLVSGDTNMQEDVFVRDRGVTGPPAKPDMMIRNAGDNTYLGNNVYNRTGTGQTKSQTVPAGQKAVYELQVQNDGTAADAFTVKGTKGGGAWTLAYFNRLTGGINITSQVTGTGWQTASLASGAARAFRAEVKAKAGTAAGTMKAVLVTATSGHDATKKDAVKAVTTVGGASSLAVISSLDAIPTRAGAQIVVTLSAPATVEARILNLAGRSVRTLCRDQGCVVGVNRLLWDARSDAGLRVPNGAYLMEVTARGPDGATSRALQSLVVAGR